jgi:predicted nucleic-acid-binding Zn-ribbon protein
MYIKISTQYIYVGILFATAVFKSRLREEYFEMKVTNLGNALSAVHNKKHSTKTVIGCSRCGNSGVHDY